METNAEVLEQELPQQEQQPEAQQPEQLLQKDNTEVKQMLSLNLYHLSMILSNLAMFASILTFVLALSGFVTVIAMAVMVMILFVFLMFATICTLGIIYMISDIGKMWTWFDKISSGGMAITNFVYKILPYVSISAFAFCLASVLALTLLNKEKKVGRIVTSSIFAVLTLIIAIFSLAGVLK